jgi:quercetin dioxygenase-like cupin family protein
METQTVSAYALEPGMGEATWYMGNLFEWKTTGAESAGALTVAEATTQPGGEPPLHVHANEDEAYLVLNGRATFAVGEERIEAEPGTWVFLPRGVPHGFAVHTKVARFLLVITPSGLEDHFRELGEAAAERALPAAPQGPPPAEFDKDLADRGIQIVGPPLPVLLAG